MLEAKFGDDSSAAENKTILYIRRGNISAHIVNIDIVAQFANEQYSPKVENNDTMNPGNHK